MPWANPHGKNALENWVANALGLFYVEYEIEERFNHKKHELVFQQMKEELQKFVEERVKVRLLEIEKLKL